MHPGLVTRRRWHRAIGVAAIVCPAAWSLARPVHAEVAQTAPADPIEPARSDRAGARRGITATRARTAPVIDGRLDDPAWNVPGDDQFTQRQPEDGKPPSERTELRIVYDDDALYFAIRCFDRDPAAVVERLTRRDRDTDADRIELDISPGDDRRTAYHFGVNVTGVQVDGLRHDDDLSLDWDGVWTAETSRDPSGWVAELRIPLATLRIDAVAPRIGLQVRRYLPRRQEISEWTHIPMTESGEVAHYGTLDGVAGISPRPPLYVIPYVYAGLTSRSGQVVGNGIDPGLNAGADLTLGLGTGLTADFTINPDFGEVEADQVTLNLTTFETLLPEKRPFFLAGANYFVTPFQQFYSRRIGRVPPAPSADVVGPLTAGRVWGAGKLTGTLLPGLTVGMLDAVTARSDVDVMTAGGEPERRLADPLTNFGVLRLQQALGGSSAVGVMLTAVTRHEPRGASAPSPGDLCAGDIAPGPDGRCDNDAYTAGADARLRSDDETWGATVQLVGSMLRGGPARPSPDGTEAAPGALGWGVMANAGKYGGEHWLAEIAYLGANPAFALNDAGALEQANLHRIQPVVTWRDTKAGSLFTYYDVKVSPFMLLSWDGRLVRRSVELNSTLRLRNFWELYFETAYTFPAWDNRELRDGGRYERGPVGWITGKLRSDPTRPVVVELSAGRDQRSGLHGDLDVPYTEAGGTISFRPATAIELDLLASVTRDPGEPLWVETRPGDGGRRDYVVSELDAWSLDVTLRGTYAFSRRLTMQAYAQLFAASGVYGQAYAASADGVQPLVRRSDFMPTSLTSDPDFRETTVNASVLLRWEIARGSFLSLFYGRTQQQQRTGASGGQVGQIASGPVTNLAIAKLSFLWDVFGDTR